TVRNLLLRAQLQRIVEGLRVRNSLRDAREIGIHASELGLINFDTANHRERRQICVSNAQQVHTSRSRITGADDPISRQRALDVYVELERIRVLQVIVRCLQLIEHAIRIQLRKQIRECGANDRAASGEGRVQAAGEEVILRKDLIIENAKP